MDKDKALIHHEILNLFTMVNFEVGSLDIEAENRASILKHIKMVTLLVNYEDVFLEKDRELLRSEVDLAEILETVKIICEPELERKGVKLDLPEGSLKGDFDRKLMQDAFEQIICRLLESATQIKLSFEGKALIIGHDAKGISDERLELMECLRQKDKRAEFPFQLALKLLEMNGGEMKFETGSIRVTFP